MLQPGFLSGELLDDKYRIENLLGQGGMGAVYRATHVGTRRVVAVKIIHPQFSNNDEFIERFQREAEAAGRLRHPNVVDVTDFGFSSTRWGRIAYLVMEYLDGCALSEVLAEERRLPPDWVADILEQVCSAVGEAHRLGIIHRDLKPDNIWLEPNRRGGYTVKVLDFGLVKMGGPALAEAEDLGRSVAIPAASSKSDTPQIRLEAMKARATASLAEAETPTLLQSNSDEDSATLVQPSGHQESARIADAGEVTKIQSQAPDTDFNRTATLARDGRQWKGAETSGLAELTRAGSLMGTPLYMSPEQCRGEALDARTDIYSLGVVAYRMLAGETPFSGSIEELLKAHSTAEPDSIRRKNRRVPRRMARTIMAALAKNPDERPKTAEGFGSALRAGAEGTGALLRQAVSLYSERFPVFIKLSLIAHSPLIAAVAFINFSDKVIPFESMSPFGQMIAGMSLILVVVAANLLAYSAANALTVPLVIQSIIAPLRRPRLRTAFETVKRRWLPFLAATTAVEAAILLGGILFVVPGALAAICYALYAPVSVMEGENARRSLKRARLLMKRAWGATIVITVLQYALPILVWIFSIDTSITLKLGDDFTPKEFGFNFSISGRSSLYQLLNIFVTPLTAIMTSLLYLKTRQAGGESFRDSMEQFDSIETTRSKWQARMRSKSLSQAAARSGHSKIE